MKKVIAIAFIAAALAACQSSQTTADAPPAAATDPAPLGAVEAAPEKAEAPAEAPASAPSTAATEQPTESTGHFGGPFTLQEATPVSAVIEKHADHIGKTIKVTGTVNSVCKKKGCWMVLQSEQEGQQMVRITMKDYGFFVPKDCDGKKAVVEGVLESKEVSEEMRKHLAEDKGEDPSGIKGSEVELRIVATGIDIAGG